MTQNQLPWRHRPFPELVRLAWPIGVSMLSYSLMTLVDTLFVGRLGAAALAGVGVGGIMSFTLLCFAFGLLRAVKVLVSQAEGARKPERIDGYMAAALLLALVFGVGNIAVGWLGSPLLPLMSASAEAGELASGYVNVRVVGAPLVIGAVALREAFYAQGDANAAMRATLAANLVNVVFDTLFILQLGWGVRGAALASVMAGGVELWWLLSTVRGRALMGRLRRSRPLQLALSNIGELWRMGLPMGLQMLLGVGVFALLTGLFAAMSQDDVAAHQVALQVTHFSFLPAFAIGEAASVLAGQAVGANEDQLVRPVARQAMVAAVLYTGSCGALFALAARPIASVFAQDEQLVGLIISLLYVAAVFQVFDGLNIVARCVLRGTGDVRYAAWMGVGIAWVCGPAFTYLLGYRAHMGVVGGWLGFCAELVIGAVVLWWRLERGGWLPAAQRERAKLMAAGGPPGAAAERVGEPLPAAAE